VRRGLGARARPWGPDAGADLAMLNAQSSIQHAADTGNAANTFAAAADAGRAARMAAYGSVGADGNW
jgi:hypothetical protein